MKAVPSCKKAFLCGFFLRFCKCLPFSGEGEEENDVSFMVPFFAITFLGDAYSVCFFVFADRCFGTESV